MRQPARATQPRSRRAGGFFRNVVLWLVGCWLVVGALWAPVLPGRWPTVSLAMLVFTIAPLSAFILSRTRGHYPGALFRIVVFRTFWYSQLLLLLFGMAGVAGALAGLPFGAAGAAGRGAIAAAAAIAGAFILWGYVGSRRLVVRRLEATFPDLPPGLDGLRIAQISDVHVGPHISRRFLARVVRAVRDASPDLVVVTGDLVDDHAPDVDYYARGLGALAAPLGVFAIPGNHDVYAGWPEVRARLARLPLTLLVNESRLLRRDGASFALVGTGDPAGRAVGAGPDVAAALADVPPGTFVVALAHNPALWPLLAQRGVPLTLSGHTHWGQLALPRLGWSLVTPFVEHAMGVYEEGPSLLYIHPGTGYWGIPFRIGAPPQVAVVTLRRGPKVAMVEMT